MNPLGIVSVSSDLNNLLSKLFPHLWFPIQPIMQLLGKLAAYDMVVKCNLSECHVMSRVSTVMCVYV